MAQPPLFGRVWNGPDARGRPGRASQPRSCRPGRIAMPCRATSPSKGLDRGPTGVESLTRISKLITYTYSKTKRKATNPLSLIWRIHGDCGTQRGHEKCSDGNGVFRRL